MEKTIVLAPDVCAWQSLPGAWQAKKPLGVALPADLEMLAQPLTESWGEDFCCDGADVTFALCGELPSEGYRLLVNKDGARVEYSAPAGAFYALMTLRQLAAASPVPCCRIEDAPGLALRGYMLDVGRGKIPTLHTLKQTADLLAAFKYNHLQLYMEGIPFAYPSFPEAWQGKTPLTQAEIRELAAYCRSRFIDLAPCQNSLGHMGPWLARSELRHLAEKEDGLVIHGIKTPPTTLNSENPDSLAFVERLADDLLPCFDSQWFNVGLDEPFELGKGKNAELARRVGEDTLYLDYVNKLHAFVTRKGKTMMMWGDIVARQPDSAARLPEDIVLLEWGYEAGHPFEKRTAALQSLGRCFCVCAGTSTWSAVTGITDNMLANVRAAAAAAYAHGALGLLLTDWGDGGHLQYWPMSWPAIVLAGALAWNGRDLSEAELTKALDAFVFCDPARKMGAVALDAGRYYHWEELPLGCRTLATLPLALGPIRGRERWEHVVQTLVNINRDMTPPEVGEPLAQAAANPQPLNLARADEWHTALAARLEAACPACPDGALVKAEFSNALALVNALTHGRAVLQAGEEDSALARRLEEAVEEHRRLWLARNKQSDLELGAGKLLAVAQALKGSAT